jgi:hypothetical protein
MVRHLLCYPPESATSTGAASTIGRQFLHVAFAAYRDDAGTANLRMGQPARSTSQLQAANLHLAGASPMFRVPASVQRPRSPLCRRSPGRGWEETLGGQVVPFVPRLTPEPPAYLAHADWL